MATLKEAVESGRRWRWANRDGAVTHRWQGPGIGEAGGLMFSVIQTLGNNFEIEPEPEPGPSKKPSEWYIHDWPQPGSWICYAWRVEAPVPKESRLSTVIRTHDVEACETLKTFVCAVGSVTGWICTRDRGHSGSHRAEKVLCRWD
jgi:hypothetical protein